MVFTIFLATLIFFITKFLFHFYITKIIIQVGQKGVAKRPLNHQILAYFTKPVWTKDELSKCSERNNEQTKGRS